MLSSPERMVMLLVTYGQHAERALAVRAKGGPLIAGLERCVRLADRAARGEFVGKHLELVYTLGHVQGTLAAAGVLHWAEVREHLKDGKKTDADEGEDHPRNHGRAQRSPFG